MTTVCITQTVGHSPKYREDDHDDDNRSRCDTVASNASTVKLSNRRTILHRPQISKTNKQDNKTMRSDPWEETMDRLFALSNADLIKVMQLLSTINDDGDQTALRKWLKKRKFDDCHVKNLVTYAQTKTSKSYKDIDKLVSVWSSKPAKNDDEDSAASSITGPSYRGERGSRDNDSYDAKSRNAHNSPTTSDTAITAKDTNTCFMIIPSSKLFYTANLDDINPSMSGSGMAAGSKKNSFVAMADKQDNKKMCNDPWEATMDRLCALSYAEYDKVMQLLSTINDDEDLTALCKLLKKCKFDDCHVKNLVTYAQIKTSRSYKVIDRFFYSYDPDFFKAKFVNEDSAVSSIGINPNFEMQELNDDVDEDAKLETAHHSSTNSDNATPEANMNLAE